MPNQSKCALKWQWIIFPSYPAFLKIWIHAYKICSAQESIKQQKASHNTVCVYIHRHAFSLVFFVFICRFGRSANAPMMHQSQVHLIGLLRPFTSPVPSCVYLYTYVSLKHTHIQTQTHTQTHICKRTSHTHTQTHTHTYTHTHTHTHKHIYTHAHTHTHTHMPTVHAHVTLCLRCMLSCNPNSVWVSFHELTHMEGWTLQGLTQL